MGGEKLKSSRPFRGVLFAGLVIIGTLFIFSPLSVHAQESVEAFEEMPSAAASVDESVFIIGETPAAPAAEGGSSISVMIRMILVLALAALAIYGVVFFIKRISRPQEIRDPHLKVLARVPLSSDSFAAVVSVGARAWLVGGGSGGVNLISEIDDTETLETMLLDDARRTAEAGTRGFMDFRSLLGRLGKPDRSGESNNPGSSHAEALRRQRERLKGL